MARDVVTITLDTSALTDFVARMEALTAVHGEPLTLPPHLEAELRAISVENEIRVHKIVNGGVLDIGPRLSVWLTDVEDHFAATETGAAQ